MPKSLAMTENWLNCQEKTSFLIILANSVEPIFQSPGPILRHTALEGILKYVYMNVRLCVSSYFLRYRAETWHRGRERARPRGLRAYFSKRPQQRSSRGQVALEMSYGHQIW